jgi:broad-specificity NMP kinase
MGRSPDDVLLPQSSSLVLTTTGYNMRVVLLYGPPGVGKYSVASELIGMTGFKLFHNHLTIDVVASVFTRESDAWPRLLRRIRRDVFAEVAREGTDVVFTSVFRGTAAHVEAVRYMLQPVYRVGGTVFFVQLACARDELLARVQSEGRRAHDKLTDPRVLAELMDTYDLFGRMPFEPTLRVDSTHMSPEEVAAQIVSRYSLQLAPGGG